MDLNSAQGLTKYLRSKTPHGEIIKVCCDVLDGTTTAFLPNAREFIFELICDRMSASSPPVLRDWKYSPDVWQTWIKAWPLVRTKERSRAFANVKFVELITTILGSDEPLLWSSMFEFVALVKGQVYIDIDENSSLSLLKAYTEGKVEGCTKWARLVKGILDLQRMKLTNSYGKKHYARFVSGNLPPILACYEHEEELMEQILCEYLFREDLTKYYISNVKGLMGSLPPSHVKLLYRLSVKHLPVDVCEQLFVEVVANDTYKGISEDLLSILSDNLHNKSLSSDFLRQIYAAEFDKKQEQDVNWSLMAHLLTLDVELTIEYAPKILEKRGAIDKVATIGESILDAFLKGREFLEFVTKVWPEAIRKDGRWSSSEYVQSVAKCVNTLGSNQLKSLINAVFDVEPRFQEPLLCAVTRGMSTCTPAKVDATQSIFLEKASAFVSTHTDSWEVFYYMLCTYGSSAVPIIQNTFHSSSQDTFYYCTMFRVAELTLQAPKTDSFMGISQGNVQFIMDRWLVVLERFFTQHQQFVEAAIAHGVEFSELFFELPKLTEALTHHVLQNAEACYQLIPKIPLQCFSKGTKKELSAKLLAICESCGDVQPRICLQHLLADAVSADFERLLQVVSASSGESQHIAMDIFEEKWLQALNTQDQRIDRVIEIITSAFTFDRLDNVTPTLLVGLHLLKAMKAKKAAGADRIGMWAPALAASCMRAAQEPSAVRVWLFEAISVVFEHVHHSDLASLIKGCQADPNSARILFTLSSKLYKNRYVAALYVALETSLHMDLSEEFEAFLKTCPHEVWRDLCWLTLDSADQMDPRILAKMVVGLINSVSQENTDMFVHIQSCVLSHIDSFIPSLTAILNALAAAFIDKQWLFGQYPTEQVLVLLTVLNYDSVEVYIAATVVMSRILLMRRNRLTTRHHILTGVFVALLEPLSLKRKSPISTSTKAAQAYSRLLTNLCNPTQKEISRTSLNSVSTLAKNALRRHLPILLVNFVYYNLKYNFERDITEELRDGVYSMFTVLSHRELQLVSASLDGPGKTYYRTLYARFKEEGKWRGV